MTKNRLILIAMLVPLGLIVWALLSPAEPQFEVIGEQDGFELRRYPPFMVAETRVDGDFAAASRVGYPPLVAYVQGHNDGGRHIPMLAPAMQQHAAAGNHPTGTGEWLVRFVMPKEYLPSMLPRPADQKVQLVAVPARLMAARRYAGGWGEERFRTKAAELAAGLDAARMTPIGAPVFARYNPPFVPGLLRRNEVLIEVEDPGQTR